MKGKFRIHQSVTLPANAIEVPPVKAKPEVDLDALFSVHPELLEESHVYVHCHFKNEWPDTLIRIWRTTFLVDQAGGTKSGLVHAENISLAPLWTLIPKGMNFTFLLIFSALPKSCKVFDLMEEIPQPGGFLIKDIPRNERDVYHVNI